MVMDIGRQTTPACATIAQPRTSLDVLRTAMELSRQRQKVESLGSTCLVRVYTNWRD